MLAKSLIIFSVLFLTSTKACDVNQICDINMEDENLKTIKGSIELFTVNLMQKMYSDTTFEGNVTFSPMNVFVAAYILMIATADNAKNELIVAFGLQEKDLNIMTESLIAVINGIQVLSTEKIGTEEITIENVSLAEGLYLQSGLSVLEPFTKLLRSLDADFFSMDYKNAADWITRKINQYINNQTGKRTPITLTSSLAPTTTMFFSTAAFCSEKWPEYFFDPAHTGVGTFASATGQTNVIMMSAFQKVWVYDDGQTFVAVQIPFQNQHFMLHVIKPYGKSNPDNWVKAFNLDVWKVILEQSKEQDINVRLPKFAISWTNEINEQLQKMGIKQIFQGATFPGMTEYSGGQLSLTGFTASAGLTLNEVGLSMPDVIPLSTTQTPLSGPNNPPAFIMDSPCLLLVRNIRTNLIVMSSYIRQL